MHRLVKTLQASAPNARARARGGLTDRLPIAALAGLVALACTVPPCQAQPHQTPAVASAAAPSLTMEQYLDRLMMAESGGRLDARNQRSTAVGPYQFIESTFIDVTRRHFAAETAQLPLPQLLALRMDRAFSRRAAEAYTLDTASILASNDITPSWQHLRLAFIVGPGGATRLLKAPPDAPLTGLLTPAALTANPFMAGMTVRALVAKATRDVAVTPSSLAGVDPGSLPPPPTGRARPRVPGIAVNCNLSLPSCRKWLAIHQRLAAPQTVASRVSSRLSRR